MRLMIYDATCTGRGPLPGLTHTWQTGAWLYRLRGSLDAWRGVQSWAEALTWLAEVRPGEPIEEIQYWGHGRWGHARVADERLHEQALTRGHPLQPLLRRVAQRVHPDTLWWFRTCETFGARGGHRFAAAFADFMGCRAAGHTFIIGPWQSGLHSLAPGHRPTWPAGEGIREGTPDAPARARWSHPAAPNTVSCLTGALPAGF